MAVRLLALNLGRRPLRRDLHSFRGGNKWGVLNYKTIWKHFGGMDAVIAAAGLQGLPVFNNTGLLVEGTACHHPLDAMLDTILHRNNTEHLHYAFTKEWYGPHPVLLPLLITEGRIKTGIMWDVTPYLNRDAELLDLFSALHICGRRWVERKMDGRLAILNPEDVYEGVNLTLQSAIANAQA